MNFAVLQFPASNCDQDAVHVLRNVLGHSARLVWHKETSLGDADAVIVPGGFSYGDYLRTGAIARFSPVMQAVQAFAANGGLVLGICNGFQILCEAACSPARSSATARCNSVANTFSSGPSPPNSPFTNQIPEGKVLRVPIAHGEGCYFADEETLACSRSAARSSGNTPMKRATRPTPPTRTARCKTSPASATRGGTWPASCRIPNAPAKTSLGSADGRLIFESLTRAFDTKILVKGPEISA